MTGFVRIVTAMALGLALIGTSAMCGEASPPPATSDKASAQPPPKQPADSPAPQNGSNAKKEDALRMPEVVVTAPAIVEAQQVQKDGSVVTTVSSKQIEAQNAQDLDGALRRVPGVTISRYNPVGAYGGGDGGSLYIRGQGSGRPGSEISTLFDGIPRMQGVFQHPIMDNMSVDMAQRIDVYKSAQPVNVGSMGYAAVNVVPKRRNEEGFEGRALAEYGSFNTIITEAENGGRVKFFDYYLTASHRESDGNRKNADGEVNALYGRVGFRPDAHWDVNFQVNHTDSFADDPGVQGTPRPGIVPRFPTNNELYLFTAAHHYDQVEGSLKLYMDDGDIKWRQWDATANEPFFSNTDYQNYGIRWQETVRPWHGGQVTVGLDVDSNGGHYEEDHVKKVVALSLNPRSSSQSPHATVSHVFEIGKEWEVTPSLGGRYSFCSEFDNEWGLQAGLSAHNKTTRTTVYANYARGFNFPGTWTEVMFRNFGRGDQWRNLQAETINHAEVGIMQSILKNRLNLTVAYFHDQNDHALRFVPPPPPPPTFENLGSYKTQGVEATLHYLPLKNLDVFIGATYLDTDPNTVPNTPRWTASGGISYTWNKRLNFNLDMQYVDSQFVSNPRFPGNARVASFFLMNGRIGYRFTPDRWRAQMEVFGAGENLTNEEYEYRPGYPQPGTTGFIGFNLKF